MTDNDEGGIIITTGEDGMPRSEKRDEIVHQVAQEYKGMTSRSSMTHVTHVIET